MEDDSNTSGAALEGVISTRQEDAWNLRLQGKSLSEVADFLGVDEDQLSRDLTAEFKRQAKYVNTEDRTFLLQLELGRLEELHRAFYPGAIAGDEKCADQVFKAMDRRIKLLQFDSVDTATQAQTVLVIGGDEKSFIDSLKGIVE